MFSCSSFCKNLVLLKSTLSTEPEIEALSVLREDSMLALCWLSALASLTLYSGLMSCWLCQQQRVKMCISRGPSLTKVL